MAKQPPLQKALLCESHVTWKALPTNYDGETARRVVPQRPRPAIVWRRPFLHSANLQCVALRSLHSVFGVFFFFPVCQYLALILAILGRYFQDLCDNL